MQRTVALGALWTASAAAAVGLGFLAVSLVDASASPGTTPAAASTTADSSAPSVTPTPTPTSPTGEFATEAGTVYANCSTGTPVVAGAAAAGWWIDDSDDLGEVEFENGSLKLEVHVVCAGQAPQFSVEGPRPDDSGGDDGYPSPTRTPGSPSSSPTAGTTAGSDDHGGDDHGGDDHGDDHGGDDDSGRGSDDSGSDD